MLSERQQKEIELNEALDKELQLLLHQVRTRQLPDIDNLISLHKQLIEAQDLSHCYACFFCDTVINADNEPYLYLQPKLFRISNRDQKEIVQGNGNGIIICVNCEQLTDLRQRFGELKGGIYELSK